MKQVTVPLDVRVRVMNRLQDAIAKVKSRYGVDLPLPKVVFEKGGAVAGSANYVTNTVNLNSVLLMENTDRFIARTVPHEMAHLATAKIYPETVAPRARVMTRTGRMKREKRDIHGAQWKELMYVIGVPEEEITRCHSYDVSNSKKETDQSLFKYACPHCGKEVMLTARRHSKMLDYVAGRTGRHYICKDGHAMVALVYQAVAKHAPTQHAQKTADMKRPTEGSKLATCYDLYQSYNNRGRKYMIETFINLAGCTRAGASTYYATCKKMYDAGV